MPDETSPLLRGSANFDGNVECQAEEQPRMSYLGALLSTAIGTFIFATNQTLIVACYPSIGNEFKQLQNVSWIATSYLITVTSFQPMYGKLSDFYGRKTCLLFSYVVFIVGSLFCGFSRNLNELIVGRAIAGIGGGGMQTLVSIILSDIVALRNRGTSQGVLNLIWAVGNSFGASLGGLLSDTIGWRWIFLIQVPMTLAAFASVSLALRLPKRESGDFVSNLKRVDFVGVIALAVSLVMLLYGMDRGGNISWNDGWTVTSLLAGGVFFVFFLFNEMEFAREPFAPKRIISDRGLIASYFVNSFSTATSYCMLFYLPLFFQAAQKKSASETGLWLLISVGATVVGSFVGGLTIQTTGNYYVITVIAYGMSLCGTIVATLATGILRLSNWDLGVGIFLTSFGNGCGITTCLISIIANAHREDQAIATAVSYLFRSLGIIIGLSTGSTVVQSVLRSSLREKLSGVDVDEIARKVRESLKYLDDLDPVTVRSVREAYAEAIHVAMYFCIGIAAFAFITSIFIRVVNIGH